MLCWRIVVNMKKDSNRKTLLLNIQQADRKSSLPSQSVPLIWVNLSFILEAFLVKEGIFGSGQRRVLILGLVLTCLVLPSKPRRVPKPEKSSVSSSDHLCLKQFNVWTCQHKWTRPLTGRRKDRRGYYHFCWSEHAAKTPKYQTRLFHKDQNLLPVFY